MTPTAKYAAIAGAAVAALASAWVGAGVYGAQAAERELQALTAQASGRDGLRLLDLKHERGLLSSSGTVELRLEDTCAPAGEDEAPLSVQLRYTLHHLPLPGSLMRFDWNMAPSGSAGEAFAKAFGSGTRLQGEGRMAMDRTLHSSLSMPELVISGAQSLRIAPSSGRLAWGDNTAALDWKTDRLVVRGEGQALELQQLALAMDLSNRRVGAGTASLSVEKLSTTDGSAEGFRLASRVVERGDRVDMSFTPSLRKLSVGGQTAQDLVLEMSLNGVHAASLETIGQIAGDTCGLEHATADETGRLRGALRTLMASGLTLGITRLAGTVGNGSVDGSLTVDVAPTAGSADTPILLARALKSQGRLAVKGDVVDAEQKALALAMGIATEVPGGLQAGFEYAGGKLKANGRDFDAEAVQGALAAADLKLNALLSSDEAFKLALQETAPEEDAPQEAPAAEGIAEAPDAAAEDAVLAPPAEAATLGTR